MAGGARVGRALESSPVPSSRPVREPVLLHAVTGRRASELGSMLGNGLDVIVTLPSIVGPMPRVVVGVSGPEELLAPICTGLPEGPARAEALAVRLTRLGIPW